MSRRRKGKSIRMDNKLKMKISNGRWGKRTSKSLRRLQIYDPGGHLKKCRSPGQEKCRKSASESAGPKRGAEGSAEKSALGSRLLYYLYIGAEPRSTFFGTSLGTPFRTGTFRSTFSALSWPGLRHFFRCHTGFFRRALSAALNFLNFLGELYS